LFDRPSVAGAHDRQRLENDIVAIAIMVHERCPDGEPEIVMALSFDDSVGTR
jgi:hypothetical protein